MKNPIVLSSFALLVAGLALVLTWNTGPSTTSSHAKSLQRGSSPDAHLVERLNELDEENRNLRDRLAMIESASTLEERTPITDRFASQAEFDAFRTEVLEALAALSSGGSLATTITSPKFREQLADTLGDIRKTEAEAATQEKRNARIDGLDRRMPKLEAQLGLTVEQSTLMRAELAAQIDRQTELSRRYRAGEDTAVLVELKRSDRQIHLDELSAILNEGQLATYSEQQGRGK